MNRVLAVRQRLLSAAFAATVAASAMANARIDARVLVPWNASPLQEPVLNASELDKLRCAASKAPDGKIPEQLARLFSVGVRDVPALGMSADSKFGRHFFLFSKETADILVVWKAADGDSHYFLTDPKRRLRGAAIKKTDGSLALVPFEKAEEQFVTQLHAWKEAAARLGSCVADKNRRRATRS